MEIFLTLISNLMPLYILIGVGFIAGRFLNIDRETLANFAIFICVPVVVFGFVSKIEFQLAYIVLPAVVLFIQSAIALAFLTIGRRVFGDNRANLISMCASMGNTGYFGLPLVLLLFEEQWIGVYMFILLGMIIFESSYGYYIAARGQFTVQDSLKKLAKFPTIYAVILGLIANYCQIEMPEQFWTYWEYFKGAYVIAGMMIIGAALSKVNKLVIGRPFLALSFIGKFVVWPLMTYGFVMLDRHVLNMFDTQVHNLIIVISLVPMAANVSAFAAQLDLKPEKAATTVLISTIFALFYIPAMLVLLGLY